MSNSVVGAQLTLTIQDQLAVPNSTAQTSVNRVVPQFLFNSSQFAQYVQYANIGSASGVVIVANLVQAVVVYVRCVSGGPLNVGYTSGAGGGATSLLLQPNCIFLFASASPTPAVLSCYITNVSIIASAGNQGVAEFLVSY